MCVDAVTIAFVCHSVSRSSILMDLIVCYRAVATAEKYDSDRIVGRAMLMEQWFLNFV